MSYSYIKSVFPNFENSNKVYDETLYNNITTLYTDSSLGLPKPENSMNYNTNSKGGDEFVIPDESLLPQTPKKNMEMMSNTNTYKEYQEVQTKTPENQNNLNFYELPLPKLSLPNYTLQSQEPRESPQSTRQKEVKIESFTETDKGCSLDCDQYMKHIMECGKCKAIAMKQLGVESDRFRNEEMMEIASYVIFGLFILLLIDSLKGNRDKV